MILPPFPTVADNSFLIGLFFFFKSYLRTHTPSIRAQLASYKFMHTDRITELLEKEGARKGSGSASGSA